MVLENNTAQSKVFENGEDPGISRQTSTQSTRPKISPPTFLQRVTSWRMCIALQMHLVMMMFTTLRVNMPIALVCMLEAPLGNSSTQDMRLLANASFASGEFLSGDGNTGDTDGMPNVSSVVQNSAGTTTRGEFQWESSVQGLVLSSVNMLGFIMPLMTDYLSRQMGGKSLLLVSTGLSGALSILQPPGARLSPYVLVALRMALGMFGSMSVPLMSEVFSWWAPENEKVTLISFAFAGVNVGNTLAGITSAYMCSIPYDNGWPFIFYVHGAVCLLLCVLWQILGNIRPDDHAFVSEDEKHYITQTRLGMDKNQKRSSPPYKAMLKSVPVWGFMGLMVCHYIASSLLFTFIPLYLTDVLGLPVEEIGLFSSVFYVARFLSVMTWGQISNLIVSKTRLSITACRKVIQCSGFYMTTVCLLALGFATDKTLALSILTAVMGFHSSTLASGVITPLDIAPRYSAFLSGMFTTVATVLTMPLPVVISLMTEQGTLEEWRNVFILLAVIFFMGSTCFLLLGSSDLQSWAVPRPDSRRAKEMQNPQDLESDLKMRRASVLSMDPPLSPSFAARRFELILTIKPTDFDGAVFRKIENNPVSGTIANNMHNFNNGNAATAVSSMNNNAQETEPKLNGTIAENHVEQEKALAIMKPAQKSTRVRGVDDNEPGSSSLVNPAFQADEEEDVGEPSIAVSIEDPTAEDTAVRQRRFGDRRQTSGLKLNASPSGPALFVTGGDVRVAESQDVVQERDGHGHQSEDVHPSRARDWNVAEQTRL